MFQFRPFPSYTYLIQCTMSEYCSDGFPHSEIHGYSGYLLLPVAYRSLSRPSSAPDAKAFPLRSFQLDLLRFLVLIQLNYAGTLRKFQITKLLPFTFRCCSTIKFKTLLPFTLSGFGISSTSKFFLWRLAYAALLITFLIVQFSRYDLPASLRPE